MAPELISPQCFGFETSHPKKPSDCYALGMVIYETISGHLPYHKHRDLTVFVKVLEGECPPQEVEFTDSLWEMLELCWMPQPNACPNIGDVLQCLEKVLDLSKPPSPSTDETTEDGDDWGSASDSSSKFSHTLPLQILMVAVCDSTQRCCRPLDGIWIVLGLGVTPTSVSHRSAWIAAKTFMLVGWHIYLICISVISKLQNTGNTA